MENPIFIPILFILIGIMFIIIGLPLFLEKVKPNWFYGFRLPKTLSNKETWYKSNKYVGRDFIAAGFIIVFTTFLLLFFRDNFSLLDLTLFEIFLLLISTTLILVRGFIFLKKL